MARALPGVAFVNRSTLMPLAEFEAMLEALNEQDAHFCKTWGTYSCPVASFPSEQTVPEGMARIIVQDDAPNADEFGHHTETRSGIVTGIVAVRPVLAAGGTLLEGPISVSETASHEYSEVKKNPRIDVWVMTPDMLTLQAFEMCDMLQGSWYKSSRGCALANFAAPAYWDDTPAVGEQFDYLGALPGSFSRLIDGNRPLLEIGTGQIMHDGAERHPWRVGLRMDLAKQWQNAPHREGLHFPLCGVYSSAPSTSPFFDRWIRMVAFTSRLLRLGASPESLTQILFQKSKYGYALKYQHRGIWSPEEHATALEVLAAWKASAYP